MMTNVCFKRAYFGSLIAVLLSLCLVTPGWAAGYISNALINGKLVQRWSDSTHVIYVTIQPGNGIPGWQPSLVPVVQSAFSAWQSALGGKITFAYTTDPNKTDMMVRWNTRGEGLKIGEQHIRVVNGVLSDADIDLDMHDPNGRPHSSQEIEYIAMHEIGHALGIRGHSPNPQDMMYYQIQPRAPRLSPGDIATIRALYQRKANITNPIGIHLMQYRQYEYYVRMGKDAIQQNNFPLASHYFTQAQQYYPRDNQIDFYIGMAALKQHQYAQAVIHFQRDMQVGPNKDAAQFFLADALMMQGAKEIDSGNKSSGLQKIAMARQNYSQVVKNPKVPDDMRQLASTSISKINSLSAQIH